MPALDQITLKGFKSIKELTDFRLANLNILIGANGAGKSNLVDFFRMLRTMADGDLQRFVLVRGGADTFFFNGPKETTQIRGHLKFGKLEYQFALDTTLAGELVVGEAVLQVGGQTPKWYRWNGPAKDARLSSWRDMRVPGKKQPSAEARIFSAVSTWAVHHFHDTTGTAGMRRDGSVRDFRELGPDAGNMAAFLLEMRERNGARYQRIRETIQMVAPFFDDFLLESRTKGENELVRLEWRQKKSKFPMQPWQFSDGTIRFICLATALLQPAPPPLVVIDEPELGLHPFAVELTAALLREASHRTQILVSTQSTALINHFEPDEVVVVDRVEGASRFSRVEKETLGEWLANYGLGELLQKNVIEAGPRFE